MNQNFTVIVHDWHIQMSPVREEYVATPISKIHTSAERVIYCCSSRQSAGRNMPYPPDAFAVKIGPGVLKLFDC